MELTSISMAQVRVRNKSDKNGNITKKVNGRQNAFLDSLTRKCLTKSQRTHISSSKK